MRFDFKDDYTVYRLNEICKRVTRKNKNIESTLPLTISAQYGLVDQITFFNKSVASSNLEGYYLLKNGEFAYNKSYSKDYPWGAIKRLDKYEQGCLSTLYICFDINKTCNSDYLVHYFESPKWYKQVSDIAGEGARNHGLLNISVDDFFQTKHRFPSLDEQVKVSKLLNLIETRIQTQNKIIKKYESLIKSIEEKIIWKGNDSSYVPIKDFLIEKNEKSTIQDQYPVLSSTVKGLFLQSDYFQREVASSNNIGYKITKLNDIIISPQNLWMGNITYNDKFENGIVSPSYHIYEIRDGYNKQYIATILKSYKALYRYKSISEQGASVVRRNLNMDAFLDITFPIPSKRKQDEAGMIIQQLHLKLDVENHYLDSLFSQKTYFLNNMFI